MKLLELIKRLAHALEREKCRYCLIGGHAASLYRLQERFTKDVDFALVGKPVRSSKKIAIRALKSIGLKPVAAFIPKGPREAPRASLCMITSAPAPGELSGIVDILLPDLAWVTSAVARAQHNRIDLGFAKIPVITPEDLVVAKCYALRNAPDRFQDLDDLKHIFDNNKDLDIDYLREELFTMKLSIPSSLRKHSPIKLR